MNQIETVTEAATVDKEQGAKPSFFDRLRGQGSEEAKTKKALEKAMNDTVSRQKGFLQGYRELVKKFGFDFSAAPVFIPIGRDTIPADKYKRLQKTISRACEQEHVRLDARFNLIPRVDRDEPEPDANA